jgi:hypothetical protein
MKESSAESTVGNTLLGDLHFYENALAGAEGSFTMCHGGVNFDKGES